ncbi:MAG: hypothetical protein NTU67_00375, partial [Gemmatimonadetes bacterium]|nr:hypothetical protein [Gemmatimonadota bacterium]
HAPTRALAIATRQARSLVLGVALLLGTSAPLTAQASSTSKTSAKSTQTTKSKAGTKSKKGSSKKKKKSEKEVAAPVPTHRYTADTITVGSATAARNTRVLGTLNATSSNGATRAIPLAVIHGAKAGPIVAYLSQAPDSAFSTVAGLNKLINLIDPAKVSGSIVIVPWFDADAAPAIVEQITARADIIVAFSGQPIDDDLHPYGYWSRTGITAQDKAGGALAMAFGLDVISIRDITVGTTPNRDDVLGSALAGGKSVLLVEGGRANAAAASATNSVVAGCLNVLGSIGVITRAVGMNGKVSWIGTSQQLHAEVSGVFTPEFARGVKVRKGQKVGTFADSSSAAVTDILAPRDGIITYIRGTPTAAKDAVILTVATNYGPVPPPFSKPKP